MYFLLNFQKTQTLNSQTEKIHIFILLLNYIYFQKDKVNSNIHDMSEMHYWSEFLSFLYSFKLSTETSPESKYR